MLHKINLKYLNFCLIFNVTTLVTSSKKGDNMQVVNDYLSKNAVTHFATLGLDNKPKVRPFGYMLSKEDKIYFCTSNEKQVYKELQNNPNIEISVAANDGSWLRISAKVEFDNDVEIKKLILEKSPLVKSIYKSFDNPVFETFYLKEVKATITSLATGKSETFEF